MLDTKKARQIARELDFQLAKQKGKMVAIEPQSGDYFIGKDANEAHDKAMMRHPGKQVFFHRIGFKAAFFIGAVTA